MTPPVRLLVGLLVGRFDRWLVGWSVGLSVSRICRSTRSLYYSNYDIRESSLFGCVRVMNFLFIVAC